MAVRAMQLIVIIVLVFTTSFSSVQARSGDEPKLPSLISPDALATVSGGGTVVVAGVPNTLASFGVNAARPTGFVAGGAAVGHINYDKHAKVAGNHVNVPVVLMAAELTATPSPNGSGGRAILVGDCTAAGAECPAGIESVLVYVEDNADSGAGSDVFQISYCVLAPSLSSAGCTLAEGGVLRSGNIQVSQ